MEFSARESGLNRDAEKNGNFYKKRSYAGKADPYGLGVRPEKLNEGQVRRGVRSHFKSPSIFTLSGKGTT